MNTTETLVPEPTKQEELKTVLMKKYRDLLVDKLTRRDLEELQNSLKSQYDTEHGWNQEIRRKFELKLQEYMHEEILKREIAGIETLLQLITSEDLIQQTR
jgi:hypothetical protein